jgi:hypothetical protein
MKHSNVSHTLVQGEGIFIPQQHTQLVQTAGGMLSLRTGQHLKETTAQWRGDLVDVCEYLHEHSRQRIPRMQIPLWGYFNSGGVPGFVRIYNGKVILTGCEQQLNKAPA